VFWNSSALFLRQQPDVADILPGEQPSIMDRELFDAVQQKLRDQWSHRTVTRNASDHLLTGLLYDDLGHRMVPTHATKARIAALASSDFAILLQNGFVSSKRSDSIGNSCGYGPNGISAFQGYRFPHNRTFIRGPKIRAARNGVF
jgi:hypothetical protein